MANKNDITTQISIKNASRIIIKIGSALITEGQQGKVRFPWLKSLASDVRKLRESGKDVVIVTSGATALGREPLGISSTIAPSSIPVDEKQAAAALGQFSLFHAWHHAFMEDDMKVAQILLSTHDTEDRLAHLNARATLEALIRHNVVPVINENDTVTTNESRFGDNDRLAGRVGQMIGADLVIILSTTDGLYTADPHKDKNARHISVIKNLTEEYLQMAGDAPVGISTGGMKAKLEAARITTGAGIPMLIASGTKNNPIQNLQETPPAQSTLFLAQGTLMNARKRWIQAHVDPKGVLYVDNGAHKALTSGKSLLPIGVTTAEGTFRRGDAVQIKTMNKKLIGIGLSGYNSWDTNRICGHKSTDLKKILGYAAREELIHRDDLVIHD